MVLKQAVVTVETTALLSLRSEKEGRRYFDGILLRERVPVLHSNSVALKEESKYIVPILAVGRAAKEIRKKS